MNNKFISEHDIIRSIKHCLDEAEIYSYFEVSENPYFENDIYFIDGVLHIKDTKTPFKVNDFGRITRRNFSEDDIDWYGSEKNYVTLQFKKDDKIEKIILNEDGGVEAYIDGFYYDCTCALERLAAEAKEDDITLSTEEMTVKKGGVLTKYAGCAPRVIVPKGVTEIAPYTFFGNKNLREVIFQTGLKKIGIGSFSKCTNLSNVIFPEGLRSIGSQAFELCKNITRVDVPATVEDIFPRAFYGSGVKEVVFRSDDTFYFGEENNHSFGDTPYYMKG